MRSLARFMAWVREWQGVVGRLQSLLLALLLLLLSVPRWLETYRTLELVWVSAAA